MNISIVFGCGGLSAIFVDEEIVLALYVLKVSTVAVALYEPALAEHEVGALGAESLVAESTAQEIGLLAQALKASVRRCGVVVACVAHHHVGAVVTMGCHGLYPLVRLRHMARVGHEHPLVVGRLHADGECQLSTAHEERSAGHKRGVEMRV